MSHHNESSEDPELAGAGSIGAKARMMSFNLQDAKADETLEQVQRAVLNAARRGLFTTTIHFYEDWYRDDFNQFALLRRLEKEGILAEWIEDTAKVSLELDWWQPKAPVDEDRSRRHRHRRHRRKDSDDEEARYREDKERRRLRRERRRKEKGKAERDDSSDKEGEEERSPDRRRRRRRRHRRHRHRRGSHDEGAAVAEGLLPLDEPLPPLEAQVKPTFPWPMAQGPRAPRDCEVIVYTSGNHCCPYTQAVLVTLLYMAPHVHLTVLDIGTPIPKWFKDYFAPDVKATVPIVLYGKRIFTDATKAITTLAAFGDDGQDDWVARVREEVIPAYYEALNAFGPSSRRAFRDMEAVLQEMATKREGVFFNGDTPGRVDFLVLPWIARIPLLRHFTAQRVRSSFAAYHEWAVALTELPEWQAVEIPTKVLIKHATPLRSQPSPLFCHWFLYTEVLSMLAKFARAKGRQLAAKQSVDAGVVRGRFSDFVSHMAAYRDMADMILPQMGSAAKAVPPMPDAATLARCKATLKAAIKASKAADTSQAESFLGQFKQVTAAMAAHFEGLEGSVYPTLARETSSQPFQTVCNHMGIKWCKAYFPLAVRTLPIPLSLELLYALRASFTADAYMNHLRHIRKEVAKSIYDQLKARDPSIVA